MVSVRRIPEATVARLPIYLRVLTEASEETISSDGLAARAGYNAAQVRKDLSYLGSYGTRGVGYEVEYLVRQINRELGLSADRRVAIVGVGNLGMALARYQGFGGRGFKVVAAFDPDPRKIGGAVGVLRISPLAEMPQVIAEKRIDTAVVTTPGAVAQETVDALVAAGVRSILNFAPVRVLVPQGVSVRQVDLGIELQILSYYAAHSDDPEDEAAAAAGQ